jgi:hypothetical protein
MRLLRGDGYLSTIRVMKVGTLRKVGRNLTVLPRRVQQMKKRNRHLDFA